MSRLLQFPDPNDRSLNNPSILVSSTRVLGLYRQLTKNRESGITETVKDWFISEAKNRGWNSAHFNGMQCLLSMDKTFNNFIEDDSE